MSNDRNSTGAVPRRSPTAAGRLAAFSRWRRERPFWGSALAIIAGLEIYSAAAAPISVMAMQGLPGLLTIVVALVAVIMGAVTLFQPIQRVITGWVILVLGPISILATNLGGFVVGMILLVVGGALILSWQPVAAGAASGATAAVPAATAVHSTLVADAEYLPPEQRAASALPAEPVPTEPTYTQPTYTEPTYTEPTYTEPTYTEPTYTEPTYTEPTHAEPTHAEPTHAETDAEPAPTETYAEPVGYGDAAYDEPVAEPMAEPATRNPWRTVEPVAAAPAYTEPVVAEPVVAGPVAAEPRVAEPRVAEPVVAEPVAVEPVAQPVAAESGPEDTEVTRNPWRSRTPPPETPADSSGSPVVEDDDTTRADGDKQDAGTRSWFGNSPLPPMEPPKNFVRTTLLIPLILISIAASGLLAAPSAQAETADLPCLIPILCPAATPTPTPGAAPSAAPSATPSSGLTLPTLPDLNLVPGTGDDKATTPAKAAALPADCPTTALPGTTAGGQAAIDGAAAIQACQAAGDTAKVTAAAAATDDPQNASGLLSTMKASRLEMSGFTYNGIKTLNTAKGPLKALSFSVDTLTVDNYDHMYPNSFGETSLKNGPQAVLKGHVRLYVTSMTGKIYGLLNLTFTPDFAPPLVLPSMFFTDTVSKVVFVSADSISLPGFGLAMAD